MEGTHTVKLEKLIGVIQTDTQSKVRLNGPRLRGEGERERERERLQRIMQVRRINFTYHDSWRSTVDSKLLPSPEQLVLAHSLCV